MEKPKLLLDENIGILVAKSLRIQGYDVWSVLEESPGMKDLDILGRALRENRIIVTLDKDFGRLVYLHSRKHAGVILLRLGDESPKNIIKILGKLLPEYTQQLAEKFVTVSETKIRFR